MEIPAHTNGILALSWSANGKFLVSAGRDLMVKIFDLQKGNGNCCVAVSYLNGKINMDMGNV